MVNVGNNSDIPDITAVVHVWCNPAFIYSSLHRIQFTVTRCFVIAAFTVFLFPVNFKPATVLMGQAQTKSLFSLVGNVWGNKKKGTV
jgi:hypothetical protein